MQIAWSGIQKGYVFRLFWDSKYLSWLLIGQTTSDLKCYWWDLSPLLSLQFVICRLYRNFSPSVQPVWRRINKKQIFYIRLELRSMTNSQPRKHSTLAVKSIRHIVFQGFPGIVGGSVNYPSELTSTYLYKDLFYGVSHVSSKCSPKTGCISAHHNCLVIFTAMLDNTGHSCWGAGGS